jgi:hypothetical protein
VISPKTVSNHLEHIYAKLGGPNRVTAALFATQHGLIAEDEPAPERAGVLCGGLEDGVNVS